MVGSRLLQCINQTLTHKKCFKLYWKNFRKTKMKASGICGDPEADNWLCSSTEISDIPCFISYSSLTGVTEWFQIMRADATFASPAARICLETGNSLGDRHRLLLSPHHQSVLQWRWVNCGNNIWQCKEHLQFLFSELKSWERALQQGKEGIIFSHQNHRKRPPPLVGLTQSSQDKQPVWLESCNFL